MLKKESKTKKNLEEHKKKIIDELNKNRENYMKEKQERYIKNYKVLRHKEQPKCKKAKL